MSNLYTVERYNCIRRVWEPLALAVEHEARRVARRIRSEGASARVVRADTGRLGRANWRGVRPRRRI